MSNGRRSSLGGRLRDRVLASALGALCLLAGAVAPVAAVAPPGEPPGTPPPYCAPGVPEPCFGQYTPYGTLTISPNVVHQGDIVTATWNPATDSTTPIWPSEFGPSGASLNIPDLKAGHLQRIGTCAGSVSCTYRLLYSPSSFFPGASGPEIWQGVGIQVQKVDAAAHMAYAPIWFAPDAYTAILRIEDPSGAPINAPISVRLQREATTVTTYPGDTVVAIRIRAGLGYAGWGVGTSLVEDEGNANLDLRALNPTLAQYFDADNFPAGLTVNIPAIDERSFTPFTHLWDGDYARPCCNFGTFRGGEYTITVSSAGYRESLPVTFEVPHQSQLADHAKVTARLRHTLEPRANFDWSLIEPAGTVHFVSTSTRGDGGNGPAIVDWDWAFGDGQTGTGETVDHLYDAPGKYLATLKVTDANDLFSSVTREVNVAAPELEVTLEGDPEAHPLGEAVPVTITVAASEGVGSLTGLRFVGTPLHVFPVDSGTATALTPSPTTPFDLAPGESKEFTGSVTFTKAGAIQLSSTVKGKDAADTEVSDQGTLRASLPGLAVTVTGAECVRVVEGDPKRCIIEFGTGEDPTPVEVTLTVEIKNPVIGTVVDNVVVEEALTLTAADGGTADGLVEIDGPLSDLGPIQNGQLGSLQAGQSRTVTFHVRASKDGRFIVEARASGDASPAEAPVGATGPALGFADLGLLSARTFVSLLDPEEPLHVTAKGKLRLDVGGSLIVNDDGDAGDADTADGICDADVDPDTATTECTLRAAIQESNARQAAGKGTQTIEFDIPGGGPPTIAPTDALPDVSGTTEIDGSTQAGGWVLISGSAAGEADGLRLTGSDSTVRGLIINGFEGRANSFETINELFQRTPGSAGLVLGGTGSHQAVGNRIGTNASGTASSANSIGILVESENNEIGSADATMVPCSGDCNVVSGNGIGIFVAGSGTDIKGNVVGLGADTVSALGPPIVGIYVSRGGTTIGDAASQPGSAPGNIISGNLDNIELNGASPSATIRGNLIGLGASGQANANSNIGVHVVRGDATVGGLLDGEGNVISGHTFSLGIGVYGRSTAESVIVEGNLVGLDPAGELARPNKTGVLIDAEQDGATVHATIRGNVVSGNSGTGISNTDDAAVITGNRIGTDKDGETAVGNRVGISSTSLIGGHRPVGGPCEDPCNLISGNLEEGANAYAGAKGNFIGTDLTGASAIANGDGVYVYGELGGLGSVGHGTCTLDCNLIAGNSGYGVVIGFVRVTGAVNNIDTQMTSVGGNFVGVNVAGDPLGNEEGGIWVASTPTTIGGADPRSANWIANNGGPGIVLQSGPSRYANAEIRGNRIDANDGLGIDLALGPHGDGDGPTANDGSEDLDVGPNGLLNKPSTGTARVIDGELIVKGRYERPSEDLFEPYRLELFANESCDASGFGEGADSLAEVTAFLSGGFWEFSEAIADAPRFITATMTDENGNTSEFGPCWPVLSGTLMLVDTPAGEDEIDTDSSIPIGNEIEIDPDGAHPEVRIVVGHGSLILDRPLSFAHSAGTVILDRGPTDDPPGDGTAYDQKQAALATLQSLPSTGNRTANRRVNKAETRIAASLATWRWLGEDALRPAAGRAVFHAERKAIKLLTGPLFTGNAAVADVIESLLASDRRLVKIAIAADANPRHVSRANQRVARADALIASGDYVLALNALKSAWLVVR